MGRAQPFRVNALLAGVLLAAPCPALADIPPTTTRFGILTTTTDGGIRLGNHIVPLARPATTARPRLSLVGLYHVGEADAALLGDASGSYGLRYYVLTAAKGCTTSYGPFGSGGPVSQIEQQGDELHFSTAETSSPFGGKEKRRAFTYQHGRVYEDGLYVAGPDGKRPFRWPRENDCG